jgi:hypothetical protein
MSDNDITNPDATMGQNPGAQGDFASGHDREGQGQNVSASARRPEGTDQPRADELIDDDMDAAGEDEPIPGIDDSTEAGLNTPTGYNSTEANALRTPNDFDEGQTNLGKLDDGIENNFDEGQAGGGVDGHHELGQSNA